MHIYIWIHTYIKVCVWESVCEIKKSLSFWVFNKSTFEEGRDIICNDIFFTGKKVSTVSEILHWFLFSSLDWLCMIKFTFFFFFAFSFVQKLIKTLTEMEILQNFQSTILRTDEKLLNLRNLLALCFLLWRRQGNVLFPNLWQPFPKIYNLKRKRERELVVGYVS